MAIIAAVTVRWFQLSVHTLKPPAFQFYADDFLAGTITMSHAERGLYIQLLCLQWAQGSVSIEDATTLAGSVPFTRVLSKFDNLDGQLRNRRLESERQKQADYRAIQSAKGKASAKARFNHGSTEPQPDREPRGQPKANSPSPSPSPSPNAEREQASADRPSLAEVQFHASTIGLGAWKAEDWFNEMEGCGWKDHQGRDVVAWKAILARVRTKWEADGRPTTPPVSSQGNGRATTAGGGDTFWKDKARMDMVESSIKAIEARASHTAMDVIIQPQDKEKYRALKNELRELRKKMGL